MLFSHQERPHALSNTNPNHHLSCKYIHTLIPNNDCNATHTYIDSTSPVIACCVAGLLNLFADELCRADDAASDVILPLA